jgi:CRISPR/Cas system CMR-associated protein Cmr1 (group 7 of RAMP superfamily)
MGAGRCAPLFGTHGSQNKIQCDLLHDKSRSGQNTRVVPSRTTSMKEFIAFWFGVSSPAIIRRYTRFRV